MSSSAKDPLGGLLKSPAENGNGIDSAPGYIDNVGPLSKIDTKILFGLAKPGYNNLVGAHSAEVLNLPEYQMNPAISVNPDGIVSVTDFKAIIMRKDGTVGFSKAKSPNVHTIAQSRGATQMF